MKVKGIAKLLSVVMTLTCISFPAVANAADDTADATSVVKESLYNNGDWGNYINTFSYGVGNCSEWLDYTNPSKSMFEDHIWTAQLNDNTLDPETLTERPSGWSAEGKVTNPTKGADNMIEYALGWGYRGFSPFWATSADKLAGNKYPAGTVDARDYADNGYVYYDINLEKQDLTDVYLTVGYHNDLWSLGYYQDKWSAVTHDTNFDNVEKLEAADANWKNGTGNYMTIRLRGVPAADYYDLEKGGFQTVKVPFSAFAADDVAFNKIAGKTSGLTTADNTTAFNPALIKTVGIARKDSKNSAEFTSKIKDIKFVSIEAPTNLTATALDDGSVELFWDETNSDVTYQIKKTADGVVSYFDVTEGTYYYDEDVDANNKDVEVRYAVVANNAAYDLTAESEEVVINKTVKTTALKDRVFIPNNWGDDMSTFAYAVGWATEWLDYKNDLGSSFADGVWSASLDDNTYTADQLVKRGDYVSSSVAADVYANPHTDDSTGMIEQVTGWGYRGFAPRWNSNVSNEENKYPAAVMDLRKYADNGNIVYTINVEDQDIDDVYLTIGTYKDFWDLGWYWEGTMASTFSYNSTAIDAEKLDEIKAPKGTVSDWRKGEGSYRTIRLAGVPLKNYYDAEKGGFQTIHVPISDFVDNATFRKMAGKIKNGNNILQSADDSTPVNLGLVRTIGIARVDSHKGTKFTSQIKDIAIVAPTGVRDFTGSYNKSTGAVNLTWKPSTEQNIAKVQLIKTVDGVKTVIDLDKDATSYTDTVAADSKAEVRYSVVVTESEFNAEAATDEFIVNKRVATSSLKKRMVNANGASWSYDLSAISGYVGAPTNEWGDYSAETSNSGDDKILTTSINDNTLSADKLTNGNNTIKDSNAKGMIEPKTGWGFKAMAIQGYSDSKLPAGVVDLLDYEDGYAVFNVRVDEGNLDGVYASVIFANTLIDINTFYSDSHEVWNRKDLRDTDLLDATYGAGKWEEKSNFVKFRVAGVSLADYYDMEKGGFQIVKIPLKKFTTAPDFRATYEKGKYLADQTNTSSINLNLGLVKGMGIARKDTDPNTASNFKFSFKDYAFVAPAPATKVKAEKVSNGVKISWLESTDADVTTKLVKMAGRNTTEINVTGGEYVDTTVGANDEVTYYLVTTDTTYGTTAESEKVRVNTPELKEEKVLDFKAGSSKDNDHLDTDVNGNKLEAKPVAWYTSADNKVSEWGEYSDYWNGRPVNDGSYRVEKFWLVDNDYAHTWASYIKKVGNALKEAPYTPHGGTAQPAVTHEYGLAGYEFNENVGTIKDISAYKDGYLVMDVKMTEPNGGNLNLDGSYFTVEFAKGAWDIQNNVNDQWNYGVGRVYTSIVRGVPVADYYDASKGGYQQVIIPLSAFTNAENPEMKYVKTRQQTFENSYADDVRANYDFANYMMAFKGAGFARKNFSNATGVEYTLNEMYIIDVPAPRNVSADFEDGKITVSWSEASLDGASTYEVYRDGRKLTTVDGLSFVDPDVTGGSHTYAVKTVSPNYKNATSAAAEATVTVPIMNEIKMFAGTGASREETKYVVAGTMEIDVMSLVAGTQGYAAVYTADGALKAVKTAALGSETASTLVLENVASTDVVKAFIWNSDMTPVCDEVTAALRPTRVLTIGDEVSAQAVEYLDEIAADEDKDVEVTSLYVDGASMHNHYENFNAGSYAYTKSVNGAVANAKVSIKEVIEAGDWDYVILQDRAAYEGFNAYYAEDGAAYTEIPAIVSAIRTASPSVRIYASEGLGYDETWYGEQSEELQEELGEIGAGSSWAESFMVSMYIAGGISINTDSVADFLVSDYIDMNYELLGYEGDATFVDGINLTADGKYASSLYIYRAIAEGATLTGEYVPSGVTDAAGILETLNF